VVKEPFDNPLAIASCELQDALTTLYDLAQIKNSIAKEHIEGTPYRITNAIIEMLSGCWEDPEVALKTFSESTYDEIIYVNDIAFVSNCAHHNLPFVGKCHFGYLPDGKIVGLSKIPRLIKIYAKRPQVQEKLTQEIVDTFMKIVKPHGCGLIMEAWHMCMMIRGVEQTPAYTKTTALRGKFKDDKSLKEEYLDGVKQCSKQIWP
jgi:GTP cyclohydrolase I